jgi:hypothetical protein
VERTSRKKRSAGVLASSGEGEAEVSPSRGSLEGPYDRSERSGYPGIPTLVGVSVTGPEKSMTDTYDQTDFTHPVTPCLDGCTPDGPCCPEGGDLFRGLWTTIEPAQDLAFYGMPDRERQTLWRAWNVQANRYLAHCRFAPPPINYAGFHHDYQQQRPCTRCHTSVRWVLLLVGGKTVFCCSQCHERERWAAACLVQKLGWAAQWPENGFARSIFLQVRGWLEEEWLGGSLLDTRFEEWQMGFSPRTPQWAAYSRYYGVFLADCAEPYTFSASGKYD